MRHRAFQRVQIILLLGVVWIVLNEELDIATFVTGLVVGAIAVWITNVLVLKGSYRRTYHIRFWNALGYALRLFYEIYAAGFEAVYRMFTGRINIGIVDITTELQDEFMIILLANSITLTPGTVTLDRQGPNLKVIWLTTPTRDPQEAGEQIKGLFERLLSNAVKRRRS